VALKLRSLNYEDVFALKGGFDAWKRAGYPLEAKETAIILPPPT
jgi:rhodanese-related sulfurtransferase